MIQNAQKHSGLINVRPSHFGALWDQRGEFNNCLQFSYVQKSMYQV